MSSKCVFAKRKGRSTAAPKPVQIEQSLDTMKQAATRQLGYPSSTPVVAIYDEDDNLITDVSQLKAGMTIFCSTIEPKGQESPKESPQRRSSNRPVYVLPNAVHGPGFDEGPKLDLSNIKPLNMEDRRSSAPRSSGPAIPVAPPKPLQLSSSSDSEPEIKSPPVRMPRPQASPGSRPAPPPVSSPMTPTIMDSDSASTVSSVSRRKKFKQHVNDFYREAPEIERNIRAIVNRDVMQMIGELENSYESVERAVDEIVDESVCIPDGVEWDKNHILSIHNAILGPAKSGKSTMLNMLARKMYKAMLANGQYKNTLLIYLDFDEIQTSFKTPTRFYSAIVSKVLEALVAQWPLMKQVPEKQSRAGKAHARLNKTFPVYDSLVEYFMQFANFSGEIQPLSPKFPKNPPFNTIATEVAAIGEKLAEAVMYKRDMNVFFANIAMLPRFLAKVFNFNRVYFVVDHIETADVNVSPSAPFLKKCQPVVLFEYVKLMISNGDYSISCHDEDRLLQALEPFDEEGCDLRALTELHTILDTETEVRASCELQLTIQGEQEPVRLCVADCGGCPGFLTKWKQIMEAVGRYEATIPDGNKIAIEKARLKVLVLVREFAPLVLVLQDAEDDTHREITSPIVDFQILSLK